ncbi:hypothetical protein B0H16DRAFT_1461675 [Mycena metata]|uniref:Uncharacterized protein n=1 Tax=Mycena metata TaxID=1033252 RepID=A0AAD7IQJ3_9AGAR|nr:hypothetical protein B0H16DRAFT_1461675 [Mycena metata]
MSKGKQITLNSTDNTNPIRVWQALCGSAHLVKLATVVITILEIVANQAGCECTFSRTKIEESDHGNRLSLDKMETGTKVYLRFGSEHDDYDLLNDQNDEDPSERGCALVSTPVGWRKSGLVMQRLQNRVPAWTLMTLRVWFSEADKPLKRKPSRQVMEEEEILMQQLADDAEDAGPDDGGIEIGSEDKYSE